MRSRPGSRWRNVHGKHSGRRRAALAVVFAAFSGQAPDAHGEWHGDTRALMGTEVRVLAWTLDAGEGERAVDAVFDEVARIEAVMSTYIEASPISAVNRGASEAPVEAGKELVDLVLRAKDLSVLTHGAFDITYESVGYHYDFRAGQRPDEATIDAALPKIGSHLVEADRVRQTIYFRAPGVRINLGGIAKGYAVERGVALLRERGIRHAIVSAGGDSRLLGDRRGQPWMVGIRDPRVEGEVTLRLPLVDEAVSTSGDYERYFEEDGVRYHHIIEPSTGRPAGGTRSATIIGPDAVMTDALSTAVFIMGVRRGMQLLGRLPDYEGVVIDAAGAVYYSAGLAPPAGD